MPEKLLTNDQLLLIIEKNSIHSRIDTVRALKDFFFNKEIVQEAHDISEHVVEKGIETGNPEIYEPIYQIDAFESFGVPVFYEEDHVFESAIHIFLSYFFPNTTIQKTEEKFVLELDTIPYRRFLYTSNLVSNNEAWREFIRDNFVLQNKMINKARRAMEQLQNYTSLATTEEVDVTFEESPDLNYKKMLVSVPYLSKSYLNTEYNNVYKTLNALRDYSVAMHFISDSYAHINKAVADEYEKEQAIYAEKQAKSVELFLSDLNQRVIPIEQLGHKAAIAHAKKNDIEHVMLPFKNNEALTENPELSFVLYNLRNKWESFNWFVLPPTTKTLEIDGMEYQGVHEYVMYETDNNLNENGKAPHVLDKDVRIHAKLDPDLFHKVLMEQYGEEEVVTYLKNSFDLIALFPRAFSNVSLPEGDSKPEYEPISVKEFISNEMSVEVSKETISPLTYLQTSTLSSENHREGVLKVGSVVIGHSIDGEGDRIESLNRDLFKIEKISLNKNEETEEMKVLVDLKILASEKQDLEQFVITDFELDSKCLYLADLEYLRKYHSTSVYFSDDYLSAVRQYCRELRYTDSFLTSVRAVDAVAQALEPAELHESLVEKDYVFTVDVEHKTLYLYESGEVSYQTALEGDTVGAFKEATSSAVRAHLDALSSEGTDSPLNELIQNRQSNFLLPIYNKRTAEVFDVILFN